MKKVHNVCENYGDTVFPHCPSDARKNGHVIVILNSECFKLKACTQEGEPEALEIEFAFADIVKIDVDNDEMAFMIEVRLEGKPNRKIKILTGFVS